MYYKDNPENKRAYQMQYDRIISMAIQIVGSQTAYRALTPEHRSLIRERAKAMLALGASFDNAKAVEAVDVRGFVYVITNPAWPAHCKIGRAYDPENRLAAYQTHSPNRDYELKYAVYFDDCREAEKLMHETLADYRAEGEWFRILPSTAEHLLDQIGGYL